MGAGANLNCRAQCRSRGRTALSISASCGYEGIVKVLLESGADPNIPDDHGATPLLRAAESGHNTIIQILLHHEAGVDAVDRSNRTALFIAALNGYSIATRTLLINGSKAIYRATSAGRSPFSVASEHHPFHILPIFPPEMASSNEMRSSPGDRCTSGKRTYRMGQGRWVIAKLIQLLLIMPTIFVTDVISGLLS